MKLCDYGCGNIAKYTFNNGKVCCKKSHNSCPSQRKVNSKSVKGKKREKPVKIKNKDKICEYGCDKLANYFFKESNSYCCSNHYKKCSAERDRCKERVTGDKNPFKGKHHTIESKRKISARSKGKNHPLYGVGHTNETKQKLRLSFLKRISERYNNGYQLTPNYNPDACKLIDKYSKENNYNFQHAMNGGEFYIKELGYWVDGYDKENNIVLEIDESAHYDINGNLKERDIIRQKEIEEFLKCEFRRIKI